jgi:hypothetical protein
MPWRMPSADLIGFVKSCWRSSGGYGSSRRRPAVCRGWFGRALRTKEQAWASRISARLDPSATGRLLDLVATSDADDDGADESLLGLIKSSPGNVSLESMMTEIGKLQAVRALALPAGLFADVAPSVLDGCRARAAVEAPSHLRRHPRPLTVTLLAALHHCRSVRTEHDGEHIRAQVNVGALCRTIKNVRTVEHPQRLTPGDGHQIVDFSAGSTA